VSTMRAQRGTPPAPRPPFAPLCGAPLKATAGACYFAIRGSDTSGEDSDATQAHLDRGALARRAFGIGFASFRRPAAAGRRGDAGQRLRHAIHGLPWWTAERDRPR